ncbi:MAG: hypothetical protein BA865_10660 [Desulfobacterales bacterium S5133MH4]|nr:MAG: hypothetical protein BA865_10660 [Desulfobacterales bacterium S5133MH4]
MSFILEALKRIEKERRLEQLPDLSALYEEKTMPRHPLRLWFWVSGALLASAVVLALVLWPKEPPPVLRARSESSGALAPRDPLQGGIPRDSSLARPVPCSKTAGRQSSLRLPSPPNRQGSKPVQVRSATLPGPAQRMVAQAVEEPVEVAGPAESKPAMPAVGTTNAHVPPGVDVEDTVTTKSVKPIAPETQDTSPGPGIIGDESISSVPEEPIPLINTLPPEIRQSLQNLEINVHVYYKDPSECLVFINMQRYRVGDRIGTDGPLLEKIIPDGVIINYGDGRARLQTRK